MLSEPKDYPDLYIIPFEIPIDLMFKIPHPDMRERAFGDTVYGYYEAFENKLSIGAYLDTEIAKDIRDRIEDEILKAILHETDHWAQFMFLDVDEINAVYKNYMPLRDTYTSVVPLIERCNFFPSTFWKLRQQGYYEVLINRIKRKKIKRRNYRFYSGIVFFIWSCIQLSLAFIMKIDVTIPLLLSLIFMIYNFARGWDTLSVPYIDDCSYFDPETLNTYREIFNLEEEH